jgi:hypothetical protein
VSDALDSRIEEHINAHEAYHEHVTALALGWTIAGIVLLFLVVGIVSRWSDRGRR